MKVVARLVEQVEESTRMQHDASREDLGLMTRRRSNAAAKAWKLPRAS
jgi:hypothetical protein